MFASFKVIGGDFLPTDESTVYYRKPCTFQAALCEGEFLMSEIVDEKQEKLSVPFSEAVDFEEVDIENANVGDAALLGVIGAVALGPLGLLAGGALGGLNKKKVFVVNFQEGRKLVGQATKLPYNNIKKAFKMRELLGKEL